MDCRIIGLAENRSASAEKGNRRYGRHFEILTRINWKKQPRRHQDTNNKFLILIQLRVWWRKYVVRKNGLITP